MEVWEASRWRAAEESHAARVDVLVAAHLARRSAGRSHPVEDFLWRYYAHRPGQLRRWHPGPGVRLDGDVDPRGRRSWTRYASDSRATWLDVPAYLAARGETVAFVRRLLEATAARPPQLACFGLHEWAMVYGLRPGERRHEQLPLRLSPRETDVVVEESTLRCTHHDAFRFFTPAARGRNATAPTREGQADQEQPGCLHATMDLYKWCFKLGAGIPSRLTLDAFELARAARALDMRASPYDVRCFGLEPLPVETPAGRAAYVQEQQAIMTRGQELRARVQRACELLLNADGAR